MHCNHWTFVLCLRDSECVWFSKRCNSDLTCVVLFGACIEGVLLRDKWALSASHNILIFLDKHTGNLCEQVNELFMCNISRLYHREMFPNLVHCPPRQHLVLPETHRHTVNKCWNKTKVVGLNCKKILFQSFYLSVSLHYLWNVLAISEWR